MEHGEIVRLVHTRLDEDQAVQDLLGRKAVNLRALARWFLKHEGWDASEEAVVSALRRYPLGRSAQRVFDRAREAFGRAYLYTRGGVATAAVANTRRVQENLPELFKVIQLGKGEKIRLVSNEQGFKVILDAPNLPKLVALVGKESILETRTGLTELAFVVQPQDRNVPGVLGVLYTALGSRAINVVEVVEGIAQHMLLVDDKDALAAYQILARLTGGPRVPPAQQA